MQWWGQKTGVSKKIWEEMGVVELGDRIAFSFGGDVLKIRGRNKGDFAWRGTSESEAPPLWPPIPDVLPKHISIWEGESDAGTARAARLPLAFAATKGAKTRVPLGGFEALADRGVEEVTIGGDTDEPGQEFSSRLSRQALGAGLTVNVVRLETILDPFSGINDLNGVWRAAPTQKEFRAHLKRATQNVASRIRVYSVKEMEEMAKEEVNWLIPELIAPADKIMLAAPQKSLKSWLALELTRSLTTCQPFLRRPEWMPNSPSRVLFIQEEGSPSLWARRVDMLRIPEASALFAHRTGFKFTESAYTDELIALCRQQQADFLILDPLQRMMPGLDANNDSEVGVVWDEVFRMQQALPNLVVMIVHHANKTERLTWESIRGSSRHGGEVDLGIFLERHPTEDSALRLWMDGRDIPQYLGTGESFEVKYHLDRDKREFEMDATEIKVSVATPQIRGKANRERVQEAVEAGADTRTKIMHATDLSDATVRQHLEALLADDLITEVDNGVGKPKNYIRKESE